MRRKTDLPLRPKGLNPFPPFVVLVLIYVWPVSESDCGTTNDRNLGAIIRIPVRPLIIPKAVKTRDIGSECKVRGVEDVGVLEYKMFTIPYDNGKHLDIIVAGASGGSVHHMDIRS